MHLSEHLFVVHIGICLCVCVCLHKGEYLCVHSSVRLQLQHIFQMEKHLQHTLTHPSIPISQHGSLPPSSCSHIRVF